MTLNTSLGCFDASTSHESLNRTTFGDNYPDGSIIKIIYTNFLTYDNAICIPGPNLNVIIGTNGAGKSTIICGICLAVGGSPKVLGRSERISDYIKHGCDQGSVELHITDQHNGTLRLKVMLKHPNNCEYYVNDVRKSQRQVRELVASYNIQIDNPCTFLAQDKVKSFSEQSPVELLKNTEKAGSLDILAKHEALIEKKKDEVSLENQTRHSTQRIQSIEGDLSTLQPRVENYHRKESMRSRIKILEKKRAILAFDEIQNKCVQEQERISRLLTDIDKLKDELKKAEKKQARKVTEKAHHEAEIKTVGSNIRMLNDQLRTQVNADYYKQKIVDAENKFCIMQNQSSNWEKDVMQLENEIGELEKRLDKAKDEAKEYEIFMAECPNTKMKINKEEDDVTKVEEKITEDGKILASDKQALHEKMRVQNRIMENRIRTLEQLRCNYADEAWQWYEANKSQFEYPVYVPILHMTVKDNKSAVLLENLIGAREFPMFIFGSKKDEMILSDRKHRWKINSTVMTSKEINYNILNTSVPPLLAELGFTHMAVELFNAPDVVKQYLCNVSQLHNVPIGTSKTNDIYDYIMKKLSSTTYRLYLTDTFRVQFQVSKYGARETVGLQSELRFEIKHLIANQHPLPDERIFDNKQREIEEKEMLLRERLKEVNLIKQDIQKKRDELRLKQIAWRNCRDAIGTIHRNLDVKKSSLRSIQNSKPDIAEAKAALEEVKLTAVKDTERLVAQLTKKIENMRLLYVKEILLITVERNLGRAIQNAQLDILDTKEKFRELKTVLEEHQQRFQDLNKNKELIKAKLENVCKISSTASDQMDSQEQLIFQELQQLFEKEEIPETIDRLDKQMAEEKMKLDIASTDGNMQDLLRFEELTKEMKELIERKKTQVKMKQDWQINMLKEIEEWRHPVEELVRNINVNYSAFFSELDCAGEVHLDVPDNALDIDAYGIMIMVSFRSNEKLRRLDHQVQSGGERSVSTMLYLLALQELCPVPFRCVDEINQGMDPMNERKVFDIMVKKLSGTGNLAKTQYFLLTPKLLHGLEFGRKVTVQIVHNGPTLSSNSHTWDPGHFLSIMKKNSAKN